MLRNPMKPIGVAVVVAVLLAPSMAAAADAVNLKLKYAENAKTQFELETKMNQTLTLAGMDIETKLEQFGLITFTSGKRDAQGRLAIEQSFDRFQAWMNAPGVEYQFHSDTPNAGGDDELSTLLRTMYKAIVAARWVYVHDKDDKLIEVKVKDKDVLKNIDPNFKELFSDAYWKQQRQEQAEMLPDGPVKAGDTWKRSVHMKLGAGQSMTFDMTYTYVGTDEKDGRTLHRITGKATSLKYEMDADSPSPLKVKKSDLKVAESSAEVLFDAEAGQMVSTSGTFRITGEITFVAGEQELPGKLDLKMENTVRER